MPCIPSYQEQVEMQARNGIEIVGKQLAPLMRDVEKYLPVLEAVLDDFPKLAKRDGAAECLTSMRELATAATVPAPTEFDAIIAEEQRLRGLLARVEPALCEAGTIVWLAARGEDHEEMVPAVRALLKRHEKHREEDRAARIKELRRELSGLNEAHRRDRPRIQEALRELDVREERVGESVDEARESLQRELAGLNDVYSQRRGSLEQRIEQLEALSVDVICSDRSAF